MTAQEAANISNQNGFRLELEEEITKQDASIERAARLGQRQAIFNVHDTVRDYLETYLKEYYLEKGFFFSPVGIIGGVWQRDIYICW